MVDRDELLRLVDLHALLDELSPSPAVRLGPAARWRCLDPGHDDLHPSVTLFTDHRGIQRWRCWSGGHGGTAIDALTVAHSLSAGEAILQLAHRLHLNPQPPLPRHRPPTPAPARAGAPDPAVARYVQACQKILWTRTGRPVLDWLMDRRRLDPGVLAVNHVGADPGPHLLSRPAGLPRGGPAAVFPALDPTGAPTYLQARYLQPPAGRSRYDNPASPLAINPRLAWTAPPTPSRPDVLVVCEGIPDALTANTAGLAAVAILGAGTIDHHVATRIAHTVAGRTVWLALDNDPAGRHATHQLTTLLDRHATTLHRLPLPAGHDLNSYAATHPNWAHQLGVPPPALPPTRAVLHGLGRSIT